MIQVRFFKNRNNNDTKTVTSYVQKNVTEDGNTGEGENFSLY